MICIGVSMQGGNMNKLLIGSYLWNQLKEITAFCVFAVIFFVTFYLYHLPAEAVLYATILCGVFGSLLFISGFLHYRKKHLLLQELKHCIAVDIEDLPKPKDRIEKDYKELLEVLFEEKSKAASVADNKHTDLVDYYTMWAHQIKTPIAALSLLLQSDETYQKSERLTELFKIEQYVEIVLQYLRMESMSSDLLLKKYELEDIVKQAVRKYATIFIRKKIHLEFLSLDCVVLTDEKWLVFVLEQILSNSLKYTKEGGTISIYMDEGWSKTLVISDTGIGIEAEDLPRVFEKGFTGYNGRSHKKSTGIGLYLCNQILKKLSHTIVLESVVGVETKVKIGLDTVDIVVE